MKPGLSNGSSLMGSGAIYFTIEIYEIFPFLFSHTPSSIQLIIFIQRNELPSAYSSTLNHWQQSRKVQEHRFEWNKTRLPVARTGSRSRTCRSDISLGSFSYISCLRQGSNLLLKLVMSNPQRIETRALASAPAQANNFLYKITTFTCFPLSPSRWIKIFPILIPLQQARIAFSMLSPLLNNK